LVGLGQRSNTGLPITELGARLKDQSLASGNAFTFIFIAPNVKSLDKLNLKDKHFQGILCTFSKNF